jgi:hypothetical protein
VLNEIFILSGSSLAISNAHLLRYRTYFFDELKAIVITPNFSGF